MMISWSMRGVPRTIQTMVLVNQLNGFHLLMEPKLIIRPRGSAPSRVRTKMARVMPNPDRRCAFTDRNNPITSFSGDSVNHESCRDKGRGPARIPCLNFQKTYLLVSNQCAGEVILLCQGLQGAFLDQLVDDLIYRSNRRGTFTEANSILFTGQF